MLNKESWVSVTDGTNVRWIQIFHLYGGFYRRSTSVGMFVKGAAKVVEPPRLEYKGFKLRYSLKGSICRGIIVRSRYIPAKKGGNLVVFRSNSVVLLKRKQEVKSKYIYGPISQSVRRKRFLSLFRITI
jgi:large subunit ribosomal protein L14